MNKDIDHINHISATEEQRKKNSIERGKERAKRLGVKALVLLLGAGVIGGGISEAKHISAEYKNPQSTTGDIVFDHERQEIIADGFKIYFKGEGKTVIQEGQGETAFMDDIRIENNSDKQYTENSSEYDAILEYVENDKKNKEIFVKSSEYSERNLQPGDEVSHPEVAEIENN
jgi:hypothetical protein